MTAFMLTFLVYRPYRLSRIVAGQVSPLLVYFYTCVPSACLALIRSVALQSVFLSTLKYLCCTVSLYLSDESTSFKDYEPIFLNTTEFNVCRCRREVETFDFL